MTVRLYHVTDESAASAIEREGFRDGVGSYLTKRVHRGVWLTDDPNDVVMSGAAVGGVYLAVDLDVASLSALADYEWVNERPGVESYRVWLVPARWLKRHIVHMERVEDDDVLEERVRREREPIPPE